MGTRKGHLRKLPNGKVVKVKQAQISKISHVPKEDGTYWGDTRGIKNFKRLNTGLDEEPRHFSKKKDTKKWCKGKEGVVHDIQKVERRDIEITDACRKGECKHWSHYESKCVNCGSSSWKVKKEKETLTYEGDEEMAEAFCQDSHQWEWRQVFPEDHEWTEKIFVMKTCGNCERTEGSYKKTSRENAYQRYNLEI